MESTERDTNTKIKSKFVKTLMPRVSGDVEPERSAFMRFFCLISPVIIYMLYVSLLSDVGKYLINVTAFKNEQAMRYAADHRTEFNVIIRTVAIILAIIMQIPALMGEKIILVSGRRADIKDKVIRLLRCMAAGISCGLFFNILFGITGFTGISETYTKVAERQFSVPLLLGILLYGLLSPVAEEIVFRGLVYNRMRRNEVGLIASIIMSSLFFGIYHFNPVQGVYGFLMGIIMAWVYERYGALIYPMLVHAIANTSVYLVARTETLRQKIMTPAVLIITGVIAISALYRIGSEKIKS